MNFSRFSQNTPFKIHGKKGCYRKSWNSPRMASKKSEKIHSDFSYKNTYPWIFLSNRVLWSFLTVCSSPVSARALAGPLGPSHHMKYFLLFFWNLGNKERPNGYVHQSVADEKTMQISNINIWLSGTEWVIEKLWNRKIY